MTHAGVSDSPLKSKEKDLLDASISAHSLAKFISTCQTPMTIGVQGKWGTGKTSLMRMVEKDILDAKCICVWLNTWQYAQVYDAEGLPLWIIAGLARKLWEKTSALEKGRDLLKRTLGGALRALNEQFGKGVFPEDLLDSPHQGVDGSLIVERIHKSFDKFVEGIHKADAAHRIIFFIDDLDRVPPRVAVSILESLQNFVTGPRCVFVLAVDFDVVVKGLADREDLDGRQFFDKIIQVPFHLPPHSDSALERYVNEHFESVTGISSKEIQGMKLHRIARLATDGNPRSIKRALNLYVILSELARSVLTKGGALEADERGLVFGLACLQVSAECEELYKSLLKTEFPLQLLNAVALSTEGDAASNIPNDVSPEDFEETPQLFVDVASLVLEMAGQEVGGSIDTSRERRVRELLTVSKATAVESEQRQVLRSSRVSFADMRELGHIPSEKSKLVFWLEGHAQDGLKVYPEFSGKNHKFRRSVQGGRSREAPMLLSKFTEELVGTTTARQRYAEYWVVEETENTLSEIIDLCRRGVRAES